MPRRPLSQLTPKEKAARREYMRAKKAESRARQQDAGECIVRDANCELKARPGMVTCAACSANASQRMKEWASVHGWQTPPSKQIPRTIRKLRRQGLDVNAIIRDPYLLEYGVGRGEIIEVLREADLLKPKR